MRDFNRDWAFRLAEAGIAVFPCGPDKKPLIKWRALSSSDADAIAQWWHAYPNALIGIDLGKCELVVLDGDRHGGPDGRAALRTLLQSEKTFDPTKTPCTLTPADGVHCYFSQNGHELTNTRGNLPDGVDIRGTGGYVIAPNVVLPDGRRYAPVPNTPDLSVAFRAGTVPPVPPGIVDLVTARKSQKQQSHHNTGTAGVREKSYAEAALQGAAAELAACRPSQNGGRNYMLNAKAFHLGRMIARGWIERTTVEAALCSAMRINGYEAEEGTAAIEATLASGINAGMAEPHPDLSDDEKPAATANAPQPEPCTLEQLHEVFRKWFGGEYDTDVIDAVVATAAAERLAGDPLWLLVISGPGNAKTETVQSLSGAGAHISSTISSEGALLSATPRKGRARTATGGLLRKIGDRGILVIKDVTSLLSADRNIRAGVLAALREVYDGRWERNVGSDGGQTLTWTGRIAVVGAVTTAWDASHAVVSVMGDRFVLIRSDSTSGRSKGGTQAIQNTGAEIDMRSEMAAAVGGLIGSIDPTTALQLTAEEINRLVKAADIVTYARTAVERDYRGDVIDAHAPEMPTRFAKQIAQMVRGGTALGMDRATAMRLALRCACDSIPTLRLEILLDLASNPRSRAIDVCRRIAKPYRTIRRELEALHMLRLLRCDEEQSMADESKTVWRYSLADNFDRATMLAMVAIHPPKSVAEK